MKGRLGARSGFVAKMQPHLREGERIGPSDKSVNNKILLSISDAEYKAIRSALEFIELPHHFNLHESSERLKFGYFLNSGLASIVVATKGGRDVEAGVVGREGFVGTPLAVGLDRSPLNEVMQISGEAFRVSGYALQTVLQSTFDLQMRLSRYAVLQGMQVAQTAACNRLHDVAQRLARWLLMAQDRVDAAVLPITHDFLAVMLGTDRPSVSLAAASLREKRIIRYRRGNVEILNRKKLESSACVCYGVVQQLNGELGLE